MKRNSDNFATGVGDASKALDKNPEENEIVEELRRLSAEEHNSSPERIAENENQKKEQVFQELEILGFIQKNEDNIIFDVEKFKNEFSKNFIYSNKKLASFFRNVGNSQMAPTLYKLFNGVSVISTDDYKKSAVREPKDLFYFPENSADALDIKKIKQSHFYLTLHDVVSNVPYKKLRYGGVEDMDYREVVLPVLIYHPQYGDGYRDEKTGRLMVKKSKTKHQEFSAEYICRNYGNFRDKPGFGLDSGRIFLRKVAPHLLEKDLIRLDDFQIKVEQGTKTESDYKKIGRRGVVMFDNVRHTLGAQYENASAYKISETMGVVVREENGRKVIVATFNIVSKEQSQTDTNQNYKIANIKQSNPIPFDEHKFKNKNEEETLEEYKKRVETMESFEYILQSEKYLRDELGITLEKFSPREQAMIAKMLNSVSVLQKKKIDDFIIQYGDNGLKTFLSLEHGGQKMGDKILRIGEKLDTEKADRVFAEYASMVNSINGKIDEIAVIYNEAFPDVILNKQDIANAILRKASNLLTDGDERIGDDDKELTVNDLIFELATEKKVQGKAIAQLIALYKKLQKISEESVEDLARGIKIDKSYEFDEQSFDSDVHAEKAVDIKNLSHERIKEIIREIEGSIQKEISNRDQQLSIRPEDRALHLDFVQMSIVQSFEKNIFQKRELVKKLNTVLNIQKQVNELLNGLIYDKEVIFETENISGRVMQKYQKLLEKAKSSKKDFGNIYKGDKEIGDERISRISDNLVVKAERLLNDYVQKLSEVDVEKRQQVLDEFEKELERSSIKIDRLSAVLRSAKDDGEKIDPDLISGVSIDFKDQGEDFSEDIEESEKIKNIIIEQSIEGRQKPGEPWEEVRKQAGILDTQEALDSIKKIKTYTLKYQGEIMGFIYFKPTHTDENGKTHYYASGLNVLKDLQGLNIGANFMKTTILEEANKDNQILDALTSIDKKVSSYYIENLPFVINGYKDDYKDAKPRFSITIDATLEKKISGKTISKNIIREQAVEIGHQQVIDRMKTGEKMIYLKYGINGESEKRFISEVSMILSNKNDIGDSRDKVVTDYCVSRYYDEKGENGVAYRYLVLENVSY